MTSLQEIGWKSASARRCPANPPEWNGSLWKRPRLWRECVSGVGGRSAHAAAHGRSSGGSASADADADAAATAAGSTDTGPQTRCSTAALSAKWRPIPE